MGSIVNFDCELQLDPGVLGGLSEEARQFLHGTLGGKMARTGEWGWCSVAQALDPQGVPCVTLCQTGRPSHDAMFVWVYCASRAQYELYFAPYGDPPAAGPIMVAHALAGMLEHVTAHGFEDAFRQLQVHFVELKP